MDVLDAFFESYYRLRPVNATFTGVHEYDGVFPDWSPEGLRAAEAEMNTLRMRLAAEGAATLGEDSLAARDWEAIDRALAHAFLEIQLAEQESGHFHTGNPSLAVGEALFGVISLMIRPFADLEARMERAAKRMLAMPTFLAGVERTWALRESRFPAPWSDRALRECEGGRKLLTTGVDRWLSSKGIIPSLASDVRRSADAAANALLSFAERLAARPVRQDQYGVGADFLSLLLKRGHWCAESLDDLSDRANDQLSIELSTLDDIARATSLGGWRDIQARLADLHPEPDEFYGAFGETWRACRTLCTKRQVVTWPEDWGLRYVPIPEWTRQAAPHLYYLYYRSPAPFDRVAIHDYTVPPIEAVDDEQAEERFLRAWNDSAIKLNHVVHHGAIGHHVQNYYAYRASTRIGQVAAVDCATRIGMFCGGTMAEGWACYATTVMEELGFLTDFERVAEQHTRVRLLARAVVDLGLHGGALSLERATSTFINACGMTAEQAHAEATKASMFPGTASMYWLGLEGLRTLRNAHEHALGSRFRMRAFHDELLSFGSIPVPLIAQMMPVPR
ncbi:MAG TPA: DUF885 family protein [Gemmatimonadaceae bacterium]|nr:DUF885 family protein [Gemmatimonadaceae bacterium]